MIPVPDNQIGGAVVRRRVDRGSLPALNAGDRMTREEVMAMPASNRRALVNNETIWLAPISASHRFEMTSESSPSSPHDAPRRGRPPKH